MKEKEDVKQKEPEEELRRWLYENPPNMPSDRQKQFYFDPRLYFSE